MQAKESQNNQSQPQPDRLEAPERNWLEERELRDAIIGTLQQGGPDCVTTTMVEAVAELVHSAIRDDRAARLQQPTSERCGECVECHHSSLNSSGTCIESVLSGDGLHVEICGCKCVFPATGAGDEAQRDRDLLARAIAKAAMTAGITDGNQPLSGPQLLMLCDDLARAVSCSVVEQEFIQASVAVWRELDKREPYTSANALDASTELRKREKAAWRRYRDELDGTPPAPSAAESPWCDACQSYHRTPRDEAHKAELRCAAPTTIQVAESQDNKCLACGAPTTNPYCDECTKEYRAVVDAPGTAPAAGSPQGIPSVMKGGEALDDPVMIAEFSDGSGHWDIPRLADTIVELRQRATTSNASEAARAGDYVAWCRYVNDGNRIVLCDSDSKGAFKVYRAADAGEVEQLTEERDTARLRVVDEVKARALVEKELRDARANAIREAVECVPVNWLDTLLTGPDAVLPKGSYGYDGKDIERLLNGIRHRLQSLADKKEGEDGARNSIEK